MSYYTYQQSGYAAGSYEQPAYSPYAHGYHPHGYPPHAAPPYPPHQQTGAPPPTKKQKRNSGSAHYPPNPYPQAPPSQYQPPYPHPYPPVTAGVPPPPPGWVPPPPPGWGVPTPIAHSPYAPPYPAPSPYPPPAFPPEYHHRAYSQAGAAQHNQEYHWQQMNGPQQAQFARSKQWHNPNGPYAGRATSATASINSRSSPRAGQTPRDTSAAPTATSETPYSSNQAAASRARKRSRGSFSINPAGVAYDGDELYLDDEDYWHKETEPINPILSLGEIVWTSATQVSKAMPATWRKADDYFKKLPVLPEDNRREQSRSRYATIQEHEEIECRPVRNTENWAKMKNDPIFTDLIEVGKLVPRNEAVANRAKSAPAVEDTDAEEGEISSAPQYDWSTSEEYDAGFGSVPPQHPYFVHQASENHFPNPADIPMPGIEDQDIESPPPPPPQIEDALLEGPTIHASASLPDTRLPVKPEMPGRGFHQVPHLKAEMIPNLSLPQKPPRGLKRSRSRSKSPERKHQKSGSLPIKPPEFAKDQGQEDILAKLGVTGSPKPVFHTPGPAYMPPAEGRSGSHTPVPPPPPPPGSPPKLQVITEDADDGNPWKATYDRATTPNSVASQHTMVGSDFNCVAEDNDVTPKANERLKRIREETEEEVKDGATHQQDDTTPKAKRRAPRVPAAYNRRW